ncbi:MULTISPECIES: DUF4181 domain-containing protein [Bacillus]|uniref:DUF4181 domain-containing protein n=1 Tax=Bacillus TaxID=1386 RepID=UPI0018ED3726|nr:MULTISPECIES: DUF4181 domain-containing protein [Bacillus amyloliquefaciens group]MCW8787510.1 DUF4181 domain-containing protein [Bacillus velezensis]MEC2238282.1 DUF4181 domain-containing protein [Bacillus velezensis]MED1922515.1 DUF4181 domain-containing protein [Bacillus velezensis]MED3229315.1 DUF4181 domain-containing protein [Bacillus velezensis]MED3508368.1 DUF4181 domain-containing protein [Bacillus velezensis]
MDFIQLLIFSAVFILLSLMFQVFAVKVLNLPKPVKKQKPINGTHRLIEITLLITGIAAVNFFNEMYVFAGVVFMLFFCSGLMEWRHRREEKQYVYDSFYAGLSAALGVLIFFIS